MTLVVQYLLSSLLILSAAAKLVGFTRFAATVRTILPVAWPPAPFAAIVIGLEVSIGSLMLVDVYSRPALIGASALLMFFAVLLASDLLGARRLESCGCFGRRSSRLSWADVIRNVAVATLAAWAAAWR